MSGINSPDVDLLLDKVKVLTVILMVCCDEVGEIISTDNKRVMSSPDPSPSSSGRRILAIQSTFSDLAQTCNTHIPCCNGKLMLHVSCMIGHHVLVCTCMYRVYMHVHNHNYCNFYQIKFVMHSFVISNWLAIVWLGQTDSDYTVKLSSKKIRL